MNTLVLLCAVLVTALTAFFFPSHVRHYAKVAAATACTLVDGVARDVFHIPNLQLSITAEELNTKLLASLDGINLRIAKIDQIEKSVGEQKTAHDQVTTLVAEIKTQMDNVRKAQLAARSIVRAVGRNGEVSVECARQLGSIALLAAANQGKLEGKALDSASGLFKDITGIEMKAALTSSDIPLPVIYNGEVVELVGLYGSARQYGTVFPLGGSSVKLPKLATDPTFGLIAGSGTVTEKSPQTAWVTFNAEKFGGLVRLPTELDEDSIVPLGQFLARYGARNIARVEDHNFWAGTGAASGINGTAEGLTKSVVTDSKTVALGAGLLAPGEATLAKVRELRTKPDAAALRMGAYYAHPSWEQFFSGLNTAGDKPYQANGLNGATLDGFPIRWIDVLPVYSMVDAASTVFMLFGDVSYNYLGIRGGMRFDTSKEAGFTTDEILVRVLERLTVGKMATGAVAGLITAAA